jgi:hypothetical protein
METFLAGHICATLLDWFLRKQVLVGGRVINMANHDNSKYPSSQPLVAADLANRAIVSEGLGIKLQEGMPSGKAGRLNSKPLGSPQSF